MPRHFTRICYEELNARQQESYNFQKVGAVLADYGFLTIPLDDDWGGADFIAQHIDGKTFLKVQLKGRLTFAQKYIGRDIHICFRSLQGDWFLYPHDELLKAACQVKPTMQNSRSWTKERTYHCGRLSAKVRAILEPWRLPAAGVRPDRG